MSNFDEKVINERVDFLSAYKPETPYGMAFLLYYACNTTGKRETAVILIMKLFVGIEGVMELCAPLLRMLEKQKKARTWQEIAYANLARDLQVGEERRKSKAALNEEAGKLLWEAEDSLDEHIRQYGVEFGHGDPLLAEHNDLVVKYNAAERRKKHFQEELKSTDKNLDDMKDRLRINTFTEEEQKIAEKAVQENGEIITETQWVTFLISIALKTCKKTTTTALVECVQQACIANLSEMQVLETESGAEYAKRVELAYTRFLWFCTLVKDPTDRAEIFGGLCFANIKSRVGWVEASALSDLVGLEPDNAAKVKGLLAAYAKLRGIHADRGAQEEASLLYRVRRGREVEMKMIMPSS